MVSIIFRETGWMSFFWRSNFDQHKKDSALGNYQVLAEKTGPVEDDFKSELSRVFKHFTSLERAYLTVAQFPSQHHLQVVLGICAKDSDYKEISDVVMSVFATMFQSDNFLHLAYLTDRNEAAFSAVARPFYQRCNSKESGLVDVPL